MNMLFPGRPDYRGPTQGVFGLLHHELLCESSHDVMERVKYVRRNKPKNEVAIRLHNMIYLGDCQAALAYEAKQVSLYADHEAKLASLYTDYKAKMASIYADYKAKQVSLYTDYKAKLASLYTDYKAKMAPIYADYKAKLYADYEAKLATLNADHEAKQVSLYADYEAKLAPLYDDILAYIKSHIPDCAWDGQTLVFTEVGI